MIIAELEGVIVDEIKKLSSLLSKPLRWIVGIATTICGLSLIGIIGVFASISTKRDFFEEHYELLLSALIIMVFLVILGFFIISMTLCIEILRMKPFIGNFNTNLYDCTKNCILIQKYLDSAQVCFDEFKKENDCMQNGVKTFSKYLYDLDDMIINRKVAGRIINTKQLMEIEGSVPSGSEIIIFSSKYKIDREYKPLIINNIKKGVTYKYIVSGARQSSPSHIQFMQIVKIWYKSYQDSIQNERVHKGKNKAAKNLLPISTHNPTDPSEEFCARVKEYCSPFAYDTLTIMLYQKEPGSNTYQVIVNLPTEEEETYSYILPEKRGETDMIIQGVISICSESNEYNYRGGIK